MKKIAITISIAVLALDQLTKALALKYFAAGPVEVLPVFNLVLVWNRGVSFGLFQQDGVLGPWILIGFTALITIALLVWLFRAENKYLCYALGAIIGGAIGNIIDRVRFGAVVDFLDFHIAGWHYPAFNIADSAIVLGVAFLLFDSLVLEPRRHKRNTHEENA